MSSIADIARSESEPDEEEAATEEETDPEVEPEPEPEPAPEPPASQMTEQEAEREFKRLEAAAQTYLKKAMPITEKLGMPVQACPLCTFPGLAIPKHANEVTSDVEAAVLGMIGKGAPVEYKSAPDYERCPQCDGWGDVLTGAQKEISRTAPCNLCGGKGFRNVVVPVHVAQPNGQPQYPGATVPFTPVAGGIPDQWGRPAGHVHWGIDPANVGA